MNISLIKEYNNLLSDKNAQEVLAFFVGKHPGKIAFSSSLGAEDQVLTHMIAELKLPIEIFTLDTGRMFQETYDLIHITQAKYKLDIKVYFPDPSKVEEMVNNKGINLFYESVENRKECCNIRKILPLNRALKGMEIWLTGLRREQSVTRKDNSILEYDKERGLLKVNPVLEWTNEEVWSYIHKHNIPYNKLHDKGYPSIGCAPCTAPVKEGEDIRSGRWWWEQAEHKECGLHNGK